MATAIAPASVSVPFLFVQLPANTAIARHLGYAQFGVLGLIATAILALCGLYLWSREVDVKAPRGASRLQALAPAMPSMVEIRCNRSEGPCPGSMH